MTSLSNSIIQLMQSDGYVPMRDEQMAAELKLSGKALKGISKTLQKMEKEGSIVRLKKNRWCLPTDADLVTGRLSFRQNGSALLIPEETEGQPTRSALIIYPEDTWVGLHGDRVVARVQDEPQRGRGRRRGRRFGEPDQPSARVIRILERKRETLTGTLKKGNLFYYVIPDDPRIIQDILVPDPRRSKRKPQPKVGSKVVVKLLEWKQRHLNPEGRIIEVLGETHEPRAEFTAILRKFNLNPDFPKAVRREVEAIPGKVQPDELEGRKDLRKLLTLTIDPDDAKDFDDALSIETLKDGCIRVGVHIADVAHYVRPGQQLDREASERGNSTYLVGQVIPMLPHALSNGICSLVEGEDRLTKTVFLIFSAKGKLVRTEFANTVIHSSKRLTYRQASAFLKEDQLDKVRKTPMPPKHQTGLTGRSLEELSDQELGEIRHAIRTFWRIAAQLREARMRKGSLDLDMPEVKIYVDEKGFADRIEKQLHDESHQLIEEFMLAANDAVARATMEYRMPSLYRVHDDPDPEKLDELREAMAVAGVNVGDLSERREIVSMLRKIAEHPQAYALRIQLLRSLKQACYRASPDGHYGLYKENYTHFTSPIRRYSDLIVHRVFEKLLAKMGAGTASISSSAAYTQNKLHRMAEHLSITERNSQEAERESVKVKLLEFHEREVDKKDKTRFKAIITDIRNHGMFIEVSDTMAFGLIHVSTLRDDLYHLNSNGTALIGRRRKRQFNLGQEIEVVTERVDRFKRQIDFSVVSNGTRP